MALSIAFTMRSISPQEGKSASMDHDSPSSDEEPSVYKNKILLPSKRVSRFLAQYPNAADHCYKDNELCYFPGAKNSTCCNNKCIDLGYDHNNCGACKKKCKYTEACCRGQCVDTYYDKRHCGECNHRCNRNRPFGSPSKQGVSPHAHVGQDPKIGQRSDLTENILKIIVLEEIDGCTLS
ncbi:unnamed protein product [Lupinus luteus]|uniref:Stigma-specific Stig1 family protein n=1 Tax=Lupinus luteus TaxID=3873 RepID=A0AAV1WK05_LUPLU